MRRLPEAYEIFMLFVLMKSRSLGGGAVLYTAGLLGRNPGIRLFISIVPVLPVLELLTVFKDAPR